MNIAVLCGGLSNERDVSISSGTCVARALSSRGHAVALLDLYLGHPGPLPDPLELFVADPAPEGAPIGARFPELDEIRALRPDGDERVGPNVLEICKAADAVFLALHGEEGENGKLQALFDLHGVRYTGCGYLGSAAAMHKGLSKALFRDKGIPTPAGFVLTRGQVPYPEPDRFPCVVKPCSGGSSVGTAIVETAADYPAALETAFRYDTQVVVEQYVKGRELTVGVVGGRVLPAIEIIPKTGFYDYRNKYQAGATEELCPAPIGEEATARARKLALAVGEALLLDAYYRVDLMWDAETGVMYCIEANTLPGMTPTSLIPRMGEAAGLEFGKLCEEILREGMEKYR